MKLYPAQRRNLYRILAFGVLWGIGGLVYVILEKALLGPLNSYPSTGVAYNFFYSLLLVPLVSFIGGAYLKSLDVLIINRVIRNQPFMIKLVVKSVVFGAVIFLTLTIAGLMSNAATLDLPFYDREVLRGVLSFVISYSFWGIMIYAGFVNVLYLFIFELTDSQGPSVFWNFFTGRYHSPRVERRIFMFLDLNHSTTIAENLGNIAYHSLLNNFFSDLSDVVLKNRGSIYQYVGDEIVISWSHKHGHNAIHCFFEMKAKIEERKGEYIRDYGLVPEFKAGIHGGMVTAGEIGTIKKDIMFSGDVLNATSRIMELCKDLNADHLVSEEVLKPVRPALTDQFQIHDKGIQLLRGKNESVHLFTLSPRS